MSRRYLVQLEAEVAERLGRAIRERLSELEIGVIDLLCTETGFVVDGHVRLAIDEHPLDAHQRFKKGLGAFSLRSRWLDLDEVVWEREIRDAPAPDPQSDR